MDLLPFAICAMVSSIFVVDIIPYTSSLLSSMPLFGIPPERIVELSICGLLFFFSGSLASHDEISSEDCAITKSLSLFELSSAQFAF